jgi:SAM-dependent methyltransferase
MPDHLTVTSEERTKRSYERRPYPATDRGRLGDQGASLPPLKWMQAIGRPGRGAPQRVLIAGCGTGVEAFVMRRRLPTAEIVAVDFSPRSIAVARRLQRTENAGRPITFAVADLTEEAFAQGLGGAFDLITCHGVLSYIPRPERVLKNLAACTQRDGALYLGVNGEAHPATRLRPWLASLGLAVDELRDERRLRELLGLWDALNDDGGGELASMSATYLGGDVCGPHFNNWSVAQWRSKAHRGGWELAGTDVLPMALQLAMERANQSVLFPAGAGLVAARLDAARPAGFHRMMLRRGKAGALDVTGGATARSWGWTGLYAVRFAKSSVGKNNETAVFSCPTFHLRWSCEVTKAQANALRGLVAAGGDAPQGRHAWERDDASRRLLWLWTALGVVAVK